MEVIKNSEELNMLMEPDNISPDSVQLSEEQELFIHKALEGHNILVDACIGSGKTTAIQRLCDCLLYTSCCKFYQRKLIEERKRHPDRGYSA